MLILTKKRLPAFFFIIVLSTLLVSNAGFAAGRVIVIFYKPSGAEAISKSCSFTDPDTTCKLECPLTNPACCSEMGQYKLEMDIEDKSLEYDCGGATSCTITGNYRWLKNANAQYVDWDNHPDDCACRLNGLGKPVAWDIPFEAGAGLSAKCCGDDANEFYAGTLNGKSCDGTQVCCSNAGKYSLQSTCVSACPNITSVYWTDLIGNKITQANKNDWVKMVAETSNAEGLPVNFTLWEVEPTRCYTDENQSDYSQSGKASVVWKVATCPTGGSDGNKFKAFFRISPELYQESELLSISAEENDTPPVAVISQPVDGGIFNVGETINFVSGSYDADDPISAVKWEFGDGAESTLPTTTHSYSSGGPKYVKLTVWSRGKSAYAIVGILINSGANDPPLAVISQPRYNEVFSGLLITFNATMSTDDAKNDRSTGCSSASGKCWKDLIFKWSFDDGTTRTAKGVEGAYFTRYFSIAGEHTATLVVDDADPTSPPAEVVFSISGCQVPLDGTYDFIPLQSCSQVSKHYYCVNETKYYDTMEENCEGADGKINTEDDCCPRGFYCPSVGGACTERPSLCSNYSTSEDCELYGCKWLEGACVDSAGMSSCSDYTNEAACNSDTLGLGKALGKGLGTDICGRTFGGYIVNASSCMCKWDSVRNCTFSYDVINIACPDPAGCPVFITCTKSFKLSECSAGTQTMNWTGVIMPPEMQGNEEALAQCASGFKEIRCSTIVPRIYFFGFANLVAAAAIIAAYYYYFYQKRVGKGNKARKKR